MSVNTWEGTAYPSVDAFVLGERPGWVKLSPDTPAYRVGARWYVRCMVGSVIGRLSEGTHTVTEHEDGTITVEPSLVMSNGWHGWLRRGVFEMLEAGANPAPPTTEQRLRAALRGVVDLYRHPDTGSVIVEPGASEMDDALIVALAALGEEVGDAR